MHPPDIEIYVQAVTPEAVQAWLSGCTSSLEVKGSSPKRQAYRATFSNLEQSQEFEVLVLSNVQANFTSIWFNTSNTPWDDDKACALAAFTYFQTTIRCVVAGWQEGDAPDQWLNFDTQGENLIQWL